MSIGMIFFILLEVVNLRNFLLEVVNLRNSLGMMGTRRPMASVDPQPRVC